MPTLLHDFRPLVQRLLLVCKHDGGLLFQTELASSRLLAVDWGLFDDVPLDVVLDPPTFQLPDVGRQRSVLELVIPLGLGLERIVPLVGEGPVMVVVSLPQLVTGQTCVDFLLWNLQCWDGGVGCLVLETCLVDCAS